MISSPFEFFCLPPPGKLPGGSCPTEVVLCFTRWEVVGGLGGVQAQTFRLRHPTVGPQPYMPSWPLDLLDTRGSWPPITSRPLARTSHPGRSQRPCGEVGSGCWGFQSYATLAASCPPPTFSSYPSHYVLLQRRLLSIHVPKIRGGCGVMAPTSACDLEQGTRPGP